MHINLSSICCVCALNVHMISQTVFPMLDDNRRIANTIMILRLPTSVICGNAKCAKLQYFMIWKCIHKGMIKGSIWTIEKTFVLAVCVCIVISFQRQQS